MNIVYQDKSIIFMKEVSFPIFPERKYLETVLEVKGFSEIPENIMNELTHDQIDSMAWFFFDKNTEAIADDLEFLNTEAENDRLAGVF